jgi:hypothetical protein
MSELRALWSSAPWTLRLYIAVGGFLALLNAVIYRGAYSLVVVPLFFIVAYYLLRGVRWLWFVVVAGTTIYFVGFLLVLGSNAIVNFLALVLLLASPTRRHFARYTVTSDS